MAFQVRRDGGRRELGRAGDELAELGGIAGQVLVGCGDLGLVMSGDAQGVVDEVADVRPPQLQELRLGRRAVDAADRGTQSLGVLIERGQRLLGCARGGALGDRHLDHVGRQVHVLAEQLVQPRIELSGGGVGHRAGGRAGRHGVHGTGRSRVGAAAASAARTAAATGRDGQRESHGAHAAADEKLVPHDCSLSVGECSSESVRSSGGPGSVAVGRAAGQADTWPSAIGCDGLGGMVRPCSRLTANAQVLR